MISLFTSLVPFFLGKWYLQFFIVFIKDVFQHVFENVHRKGNFFQYKRIQKLNSFEVQPQFNSNLKPKMTFLSYSNKSFMFWLDDDWKNGGLNKRSNDSGTLQKQSVANEDSQRAWHFFIRKQSPLFWGQSLYHPKEKWQCLEALFFQGLFKIT